MELEKKSDVSSIEQLTSKINVLKNEVKLLQKDKVLERIKFFIFLR